MFIAWAVFVIAAIFAAVMHHMEAAASSMNGYACLANGTQCGNAQAAGTYDGFMYVGVIVAVIALIYALTRLRKISRHA